MRRTVIDQVTFEIGQIDTELSRYADLLTRAANQTPDPIEIAAIAAVLHSFYTGLGNARLAVAKRLDGSVATGASWHRDLLHQVSRATPKRSPVIAEQSALTLTKYLMFRHRFRHAYSFTLDWTEMESLVTSLPEVWASVRAELNQFLAGLRSPGSETA